VSLIVFNIACVVGAGPQVRAQSCNEGPFKGTHLMRVDRCCAGRSRGSTSFVGIYIKETLGGMDDDAAECFPGFGVHSCMVRYWLVTAVVDSCLLGPGWSWSVSASSAWRPSSGYCGHYGYDEGDERRPGVFLGPWFPMPSELDRRPGEQLGAPTGRRRVARGDSELRLTMVQGLCWRRSTVRG
jgi:hypothetical protein